MAILASPYVIWTCDMPHSGYFLNIENSKFANLESSKGKTTKTPNAVFSVLFTLLRGVVMLYSVQELKRPRGSCSATVGKRCYDIYRDRLTEFLTIHFWIQNRSTNLLGAHSLLNGGRIIRKEGVQFTFVSTEYCVQGVQALVCIHSW